MRFIKLSHILLGISILPYNTFAQTNIVELINRAEDGDRSAQIKLADVYYDGETDIQKDTNIAAKWYLMAAENGDIESQFRIGYMFARGYGVTQNIDLARKWIGKSAAADFQMAQFILKDLDTYAKTEYLPKVSISSKDFIYWPIREPYTIQRFSKNAIWKELYTSNDKTLKVSYDAYDLDISYFRPESIMKINLKTEVIDGSSKGALTFNQIGFACNQPEYTVYSTDKYDQNRKFLFYGEQGKVIKLDPDKIVFKKLNHLCMSLYGKITQNDELLQKLHKIDGFRFFGHSPNYDSFVNQYPKKLDKDFILASTKHVYRENNTVDKPYGSYTYNNYLIDCKKGGSRDGQHYRLLNSSYYDRQKNLLFFHENSEKSFKLSGVSYMIQGDESQKLDSSKSTSLCRWSRD